MLLLDGQVHHDTHAIPMGNYVIGVGKYVIVSPSELGNYKIADIAELLPVQLQLGIPADLAPLALAGPDLTREHYLTLINAGFKTPDQIGAADDETLLTCISNSRQRLRTLREAVRQVAEAATIPALDEALPPPTD